MTEERYQAAALEEKDYRIVLEELPEGVGITDMTENLMYVNDVFADMLGYTRNELTGMNVNDLIPTDERQRLKEATADRSSGLRTAYNLRMLKKDGGEIVVRVSGVPRRDSEGSVVGTMAVVIDVTRNEKTQEELRKLSRAVEQSPTSVVITDADGTIEYVNPKFTELTGYTEEEAIGQNPRILKSGQTPMETFDELWSEISEGREWRGVLVNKKKDRSIYWEDAWISPITREDGSITHYVAVKQDITRRLEAEKKLQLTLQDLELYNSLLQHDLRNDLQILINHVEAALMLSEPESNSRGYLETSEGVAARMVRLLDVFGRPDSEERDLLRIIEQSRNHAKRAQPKIMVAVHSETDSAMLLNARLLPLVFDNLLRNSAEFGGGDVEVSIHVTQNDRMVEVTYSDNGPGIPKEIRPNLFKRGASSTGGGYGLYLSRKVIEAYGGTIEMIEMPDEGATFKIVLPLS